MHAQRTHICPMNILGGLISAANSIVNNDFLLFNDFFLSKRGVNPIFFGNFIVNFQKLHRNQFRSPFHVGAVLNEHI